MSDSASYRVFLIMMPFREVQADLYVLLRALADLEPHLSAADGFYASATDTALLGLKLPRHVVARIGAEPLLQLVAECGLPVLAPDDYDDDMRESFYGRHLAAYDYRTRVGRLEAPDGALIDRVVDALRRHVEGSDAALALDDTLGPLTHETDTDLDAEIDQALAAVFPDESDESAEDADELSLDDLFTDDPLADDELFALGDAPTIPAGVLRPRPVHGGGRPSSEWTLVL